MKKVLIVEDDRDINKALCIRLEAAGFDVYTAEDGLQGLNFAVREQPDIMLLDISMPAGGGFSIVERLREHTLLPNIPFIVLTASKRPDFRQKAEELGAAAYFEKPFESSELLATINETMGTGSRLQL